MVYYSLNKIKLAFGAQHKIVIGILTCSVALALVLKMLASNT